MSEDLNRSLNYTVDPSIQKAIKQLEKLRKEEQDLAKDVLLVGKASDEQVKKSKELQKAQRDLSTWLRASGTDFGKQEKAVEEATRALDAYEEQIRKTKQAGADFGGDSASFLAGTRGGLDALTGGNLGGLGTGLEKLEGVADLVEFLPQLKVQAETIGNTIRESSTAASKLASNAGGAISGVTGLSAGVSTLAVVALPVVAALGAVAFAVNEYNKGMEAQRKQIEAASTALIDTNRQIAEGLTQDEAQAEIERLTRLREADADSLAALNEQYASIGDLLKGELEGTVAQGLDGIIAAGLRVFDSREQQIVDSIKETEGAIQGYDAAITALTQAQEDGALASNNAAVAEENLAREREEATRQAEQAIASANQLQAQADQIRRDAMLADANAAELEAAQSAIDNENAQIREQEHRNSLAKIADDGRKRIEQIEAEMSKLPAQRADDIAKVLSKGKESQAKLEQEYQQATIQKYEDFTDSLKDVQDDASKTLHRLARDIKNTLSDATLENDVAAFLKAQRDGELRLKDTREDAQEQQQEMVDAFLTAQEREREAYMAKQAAIQQAIAEEKQQVILAYNERRKALADQIAAERQATQERLAQEAARHQQQLENEARRANQQAQLEAIREKQQQEAHNRRLQEIQQQRAAQLAMVESVLSGVNRVAQAAASIKVPSAGGQTPLFKGGASSKGGGSNNIFANINNQVSATIGDIASRKEVEEALDKTVKELTTQQNVLFHGLKNGRVR